MKIHHLTTILMIALLGFTVPAKGQKCHEFHKSEDCQAKDIEGFKLSSLSRSHYLEVGKTITYEVVLYGQKEVIIQCCTEKKYYPLRFKLRSSLNGDLIYDNKYDKYLNNISLSLDRTELISIEISIVSNEKNIRVLEGSKACIGLAIYTEKTKVKN